MIFVKAFLLIGLMVALVDTSFAGFMPKAFQGEFVQLKPTDSPFKKYIEIPATIYYENPRNFRMKSQSSKQDTLFICNKDKTWYYTAPFIEGEKGNLKIGDTSRFCYVKIFDALNKGLTSNSLYTVKQLESKKFQLVFNKAAAKEVQFDKVDLVFADLPASFKNISEMTLYSPSKKEPFVLKTKSLKIKDKLDDKLFTFKTPDNTDTEEMK